MLWQTSILRCSLDDRTWNWDGQDEDSEEEGDDFLLLEEADCLR